MGGGGGGGRGLPMKIIEKLIDNLDILYPPIKATFILLLISSSLYYAIFWHFEDYLALSLERPLSGLEIYSTDLVMSVTSPVHSL